MSQPPKPPKHYVGQVDEDTGVGDSFGIPYHYEHVEDVPTSQEEVYRVEAYIGYSNIPTHKNVYFVPSEWLDSFFSSYSETFEKVIDIRPVDWEEAEDELSDYSQNF